MTPAFGRSRQEDCKPGLYVKAWKRGVRERDRGGGILESTNLDFSLGLIRLVAVTIAEG